MNLMMRRIALMTMHPPTIILALLVGSNFNALSYFFIPIEDFKIFVKSF